MFSRQEAIEGWDQSKINCSNRRLYVIGAGALGCEVVKNLAKVGITEITVFDFDKVELSNIHRTLYSKDDVGKYKVHVLRDIMLDVGMIIHPVINDIRNGDFHRLRKNDIIVSCVDNDDTRWHLNAWAVKSRCILVDGGTAGFHGHVEAVDTKHRCLSCAGLERGDTEQHSCSKQIDPAVITSTSVVAGIMSNIIIKELTGIQKVPTESYIVYDGMQELVQHIYRTKNEMCKICQKIIM